MREGPRPYIEFYTLDDIATLLSHVLIKIALYKNTVIVESEFEKWIEETDFPEWPSDKAWLVGAVGERVLTAVQEILAEDEEAPLFEDDENP